SCREASLWMTKFRAYDPTIARWLSRDPLKNAEIEEGHNLFAYVQNDPVDFIDPLGLLCCEAELKAVLEAGVGCNKLILSKWTSPYQCLKFWWASSQLAKCQAKPCVKCEGVKGE